MSQTDKTPTAVDPRHKKRIQIMNLLFAHSFRNEEKVNPKISEIVDQIKDIDLTIAKIAPERPLVEINKVDLAILRLIVFESEHKKTPKKVLINEAVELAKKFGSENSAKFVNGALSQLFI
ncbi:MAG: transcription antitermination factor NusB [Patescibacteria group bacterium]